MDQWLRDGFYGASDRMACIPTHESEACKEDPQQGASRRRVLHHSFRQRDRWRSSLMSKLQTSITESNRFLTKSRHWFYKFSKCRQQYFILFWEREMKDGDANPSLKRLVCWVVLPRQLVVGASVFHTKLIFDKNRDHQRRINILRTWLYLDKNLGLLLPAISCRLEGDGVASHLP